MTCNDGDMVKYGVGWSVEIPQIIASQFVHVLTQDNAVVQVVNATPFRNPLRSLDTNRDGSVSPLDALVIINRLNTTGSGILSIPVSVDGLTEFFYFDSNGDLSIAPIDVLLVVNFLNDPTSNAEAESAIPRIDLAFVETASCVAATSTSDSEGRVATLFDVRDSSIGRFTVSDVSQIATPERAKRHDGGATSEELFALIDAFFCDFELDIL